MPKFSERIGIEPPALVQLESMSDELRNSIWNSLLQAFQISDVEWSAAAVIITEGFFKGRIDEVSQYSNPAMQAIKRQYFALPWHRAYDFVEFIVEKAQSLRMLHSSSTFARELNAVLLRENSGYRFVDQMLVPISNSIEVSEANDALKGAAAARLVGAHEHIQSALRLFSRRPDPDYRNSVKESISAVESVAKILGKEDSAGLAGALEELSKKVELHGALKGAFLKMYGYASDQDGIRHAILDESIRIDFDDAKFMLVSCSAFVNFLISKAHAANLLKS